MLQAMSYRLIYTHFQTCAIHVPRLDIRKQVLAVTGVTSVKEIVSGMDIQVCRGMYISPRNNTNPFTQQFGGHIIVVARGLNRCWYRFVLVKELMHFFDPENAAADTGDRFDVLLTELAGHGAIEKSEPYNSEMKAFWMALALFCPEPLRQELIAKRATGTSDYAIALRLRIPEIYVQNLFSPAFDRIMPILLK